jgi:ATP-dependent exoDNAse (exonuclease V) alpha subunit
MEKLLNHPSLPLAAASLMTRKLLYTGVTRAQHLLMLITTDEALNQFSSNGEIREKLRNSLLAPRLLHTLLGESSHRNFYGN